MEELKDAIIDEIWIWNGDLEHALAITHEEPEKWLFERGVLIEEDDELSGVKELLEGDVVFRLRKTHAMTREDPREKLFDWSLCNWYNGEIVCEALKVSKGVASGDQATIEP